MTGTQKRKIIGTLLICGNLAFIWGNSLMTGAESGNLSGGILSWLNSFLGLGEEGAEILHYVIRKAAHFTEFACLGALLAWRFGMEHHKGIHLAVFSLFGGLLAACTDETIQIFVDGRGSSLIDVWIDTCGTAAGIAIMEIGHHLRKK